MYCSIVCALCTTTTTTNTTMLSGFYDRNGIFVSNNKRKGVLFLIPCFFGNGIFPCIYLLLQKYPTLCFKTHHCLTYYYCNLVYCRISSRYVRLIFVPNIFLRPCIQKRKTIRSVPRVNISTHKNPCFYSHDDQTTVIIIIIAIIQQQH